MEEIAHIWVVDHTVEMSAEEDHRAWFEEIDEDQEEQGQDEVDGTGVRESSEHNLVIRANTIDVNEIIHNDIIDIPEISSEGKIDAPGNEEKLSVCVPSSSNSLFFAPATQSTHGPFVSNKCKPKQNSIPM